MGELSRIRTLRDLLEACIKYLKMSREPRSARYTRKMEAIQHYIQADNRWTSLNLSGSDDSSTPSWKSTDASLLWNSQKIFRVLQYASLITN